MSTLAVIGNADYQFYVDGVPGIGRYYWTQCWYFKTGSLDPSGSAMWNVLNDMVNALIPVGVVRSSVRNRRLDPFPRDYGTFTVPFIGTREFSGKLQLINVPRVTFWAAGRAVGYKRLRLPMASGEFTGNKLNASYIALLERHIDMIMAVGTLCNYKGVVFDNYTIEPYVSMWQTRHGTRRRSRAVIQV